MIKKHTSKKPPQAKCKSTDDRCSATVGDRRKKTGGMYPPKTVRITSSGSGMKDSLSRTNTSFASLKKPVSKPSVQSMNSTSKEQEVLDSLSRTTTTHPKPVSSYSSSAQKRGTMSTTSSRLAHKSAVQSTKSTSMERKRPHESLSKSKTTSPKPVSNYSSSAQKRDPKSTISSRLMHEPAVKSMNSTSIAKKLHEIYSLNIRKPPQSSLEKKLLSTASPKKIVQYPPKSLAHKSSSSKKLTGPKQVHSPSKKKCTSLQQTLSSSQKVTCMAQKSSHSMMHSSEAQKYLLKHTGLAKDFSSSKRASPNKFFASMALMHSLPKPRSLVLKHPSSRHCPDFIQTRISSSLKRTTESSQLLKETKKKKFVKYLCMLAKKLSQNLAEDLRHPDFSELLFKMIASPQKLLNHFEGLQTNFSKLRNDYTDCAEKNARSALKNSEEAILNGVVPKVVPEDVRLYPDGPDKDVFIHSVCFEPKNTQQPDKFPLVLIHGYGGGIPAFHNNFERLREDRKVYAIDLPGFALSSREEFSSNAKVCREEYIRLIEKWREQKGIEKFVLLGHSFGGYISASYAVEHPKRVRHLILAEPWGILCRDEDQKRYEKLNLVEKTSILLKLNPFIVLRFVGPTGTIPMSKLVSKRIKQAYPKEIVDYFCEAIGQPNPTGEAAFAAISDEYLWPRHPMKEDLIKLSPNVPITFIYGERSDVRNNGGRQVQKEGENVCVFQPLPEVGHHVQSQKPKSQPPQFNDRVKEVLSEVDHNKDLKDR